MIDTGHRPNCRCFECKSLRAQEQALRIKAESRERLGRIINLTNANRELLSIVRQYRSDPQSVVGRDVDKVLAKYKREDTDE